MWSFEFSFRNISCDQVNWSASSKRARCFDLERGRKFDALTFGAHFSDALCIHFGFWAHVFSLCLAFGVIASFVLLWTFNFGKDAKVPLVNFAISLCTVLRFACTILDRCIWMPLLSSWCTSFMCLSACCILKNSLIEGSIVWFAQWSQQDTFGLRNCLNTKNFCVLNNRFYWRIKSKKLNAEQCF